MKIVVCGSFGDLEFFYKILESLKINYGAENVFPNKEHMEKSMPCILAHHILAKETDNTIVTRASLMNNYFKKIEESDLVFVINEKNGEEYYGTGTTIEIGYALARGKNIGFIRQPTDSNILSLLRIINENHYNGRPSSELCIT
jgi:nucleoside 2-deoxyribosyltransferase